MFESILVVCTGNICRSPLGERYLKKLHPSKKIESAGTGALVGYEADVNAIKVASHKGISLDGHQARQLTRNMTREFSLILAMDKSHVEYIGKIAPEARGKTMLFGHWLNQREIPDPYRKSEEAFNSVYDLIEQAGQKWARTLAE